jgi:hypothetical protein
MDVPEVLDNPDVLEVLGRPRTWPDDDSGEVRKQGKKLGDRELVIFYDMDSAIGDRSSTKCRKAVEKASCYLMSGITDDDDKLVSEGIVRIYKQDPRTLSVHRYRRRKGTSSSGWRTSRKIRLSNAGRKPEVDHMNDSRRNSTILHVMRDQKKNRQGHSVI